MKVIQIATAAEDLFALTDDGEIFVLVGHLGGSDLKWVPVPTPVASVNIHDEPAEDSP